MAYDVFISYSHTADGKIAPALQRALRSLAKPWYRMRALHVFRDETNLSAASDLTGTICAALSNSRYFVYLASPEAANSRWVGEEIEAWKNRNLPENLLLALTDGEIQWDNDRQDFDWGKSTSLHPKLKGIFSKEPLWVDLRWAKKDITLSSRDSRFQHATAMLAATIHGKTLEELVGEDVFQHRRTRKLVGAVVSVLTLLLTLFVLATIIATKTNRNLQSKLTLIESVLPFFNLEQIITEESYGEEKPLFKRLWSGIKANVVWQTEIETWIDWGPDMFALAADCSGGYDGEEGEKASDVDYDCPKDKNDFDKDGLRLDIVGINAIAKSLATSLQHGRLDELLKESKAKERDSVAGEEDTDVETDRMQILDLVKILLPDRLWKQVAKDAVENESSQEFLLSHHFNIWRKPLSGGRDAELIFIRLRDYGYCGSGGCSDLMIGFLRIGEKYELIIAQISPGEIAIYDAGRGNMPQIFTISMRQSGLGMQFRYITRYNFDGSCLCYRPYLAGIVESSEMTVNQRVPKQLRDFVER
jgi:hypothetical protein